jgi:protein-L-isoaspartate O-methyltransferase
VLIPGCGSGYEVKAFHEVGHEVMAIEFSAPAIARAHEVLGRSAIRLFTPTSSSTTLETLALD